ncbi:testis-expressed protein 47 [Xenopus laevis]|uniref:Testis-expressed protein 47 n=2 Tax=Xenopus laevis TaxID=8355 RepID=A0A1L8EYL0_XENLA|nr:testis-expressed protein 47 [Xenopus laevis]OCT64369.1 hypothetical protein XELAEV_18045472mg [Xenopus laevis]
MYSQHLPSGSGDPANMASRRPCSPAPGLPHSNALALLMDIQHKKFVLHRLFLVAKRSPDQVDPRDITEHYEALFHAMVKSRLAEPVSGLLLIYPHCTVHIIESSSEALYAIIQDLEQMEQPGVHSLLQDSKILVMSRDIPGRLFLQWNFLVVNLPMTYLDNIALNKTLLTLLEEGLSLLLKLAVYLSNAQTNNNTSQDVDRDMQQLLVREEIVSALLHSPDLQTPAEFLQLFSSPFHISNETDQVWPMAEHSHL